MARPSARSVSLASLLCAVVLAEGPAWAQVTGDQAVQAAATAKSNLPPDSFGGELLFGRLDEDFFLTLALKLNFDRENWGVGFQVPVRLRVVDNEPENERGDDFAGLIRREDWDEPSDFLRIIRYVYVGQADKKGPFYVRVGELSGLTLGHGTIMYRYYNGIDTDVWHTGINAAANIHAFGAEAVLGDAIDPYLAGLRFTVRPFKLALGESFLLDKLVIGASIVADAKAPFLLRTRPSAADPLLTVTSTDADGHPIVDADRTLAIFGVDVGLELFSNALFSVTPYVDLNKMNVVDNGWGLHLGVLWGLKVPIVLDTFVVDARTEYRRVSGDYVGPYYNTAYEIERFQVLTSAGGAPTTKLQALAGGAAPSRNGVFFDLLAGLPQFAFIGGEFVDYDGGVADGTLRLSLEVPALEVVKFSAFYYRINISGLDDLFEIDDRSAIVAQAAVPIYYFLTANLRWWRVWQASETGEYEAVDDWSVGLGFNLEL